MRIELESSELNSLLNWARRNESFPTSYELKISSSTRELLLLLVHWEKVVNQLNSSWFRTLRKLFPGEAQQLSNAISILTNKVVSDLNRCSILILATSPPER